MSSILQKHITAVSPDPNAEWFHCRCSLCKVTLGYSIHQNFMINPSYTLTYFQSYVILQVFFFFLIHVMSLILRLIALITEELVPANGHSCCHFPPFKSQKLTDQHKPFHHQTFFFPFTTSYSGTPPLLGI